MGHTLTQETPACWNRRAGFQSMNKEPMLPKNAAGFQHSGTDARRRRITGYSDRGVGHRAEGSVVQSPIPRCFGCTCCTPQTASVVAPASQEIVEEWSVTDDSDNLAAPPVVTVDTTEDKFDD